MNDTLKVIPEEDVIARRRLLDRTRQWLDFLKVDDWKPGEIHRCNYETLIKDFGLQLSRTKPRSFVITLRDNASYLWEYEDYPQMQVSTSKLQTGEHVLYLSRVTEVAQFTEICPEIEITELPTKGKKTMLAEMKIVLRTANGKIASISTDKGWKRKEEVSDKEWIDLSQAVIKDKKIPEVSARYDLIDEEGEHPRATITDPDLIAWVDATGQKLNISAGGVIDLRYEAVVKRIEDKALKDAKEKLRRAKEAKIAEDTKKAGIITAAINKVRAGEIDVEKIVNAARTDAVRAGITTIETFVIDMTAQVEAEKKAVSDAARAQGNIPPNAGPGTPPGNP